MSSSSSPVTRDTVSSAVTALTKWMRTQNTSTTKPQLLLDERDDFIILQLSLRSIPSTARVNPYLLSLPHHLFPTDSLDIGTSVCVIVDDRKPGSASPDSFLEKAKEVGLPIQEVIGLNGLKTDYRPFEARRKLCASYDLFLADKKIIPLLPKLIGKTFFVKKKNPLPVSFERVGWPEQVKKILGSTFFYLRTGTCIGIRVGRLCMKVDEIVDNVMKVVEEAVELVPKKWGNVRSLHVKAVESLALPIYQALPEIGLKIDAGERKSVESGEEVKSLESGEVLDGGEEGVEEEKSEKDSEKKGKKNKEKRKKEGKDGEEQKKVKKNRKEENEGEIVKAKGEKKAKKDKLEGGNVKLDKEKMKKNKRSKGEMTVEAMEKKGKRSKIRV